MHRRRRALRIVMWTGGLLSVLIAAAGFVLRLPLLVPLALVLVPTLASAFLLRKHGRRPGRCRACGYDLTGNQSGRCPECGTPAKAQ